MDEQFVLIMHTIKYKFEIFQAAGTVHYSQHDRRTKPFIQNFLLTAQGDHWKVATDTFRFQEV